MSHESRNRAIAVSLGTIALLALAPAARAADPTTAECIAANDSAVKLRSEGKLLDARDALVTCSNPKCPANVRTECDKAVDEVNRALPTVVFEPKDASGNDVLAPVKVSMDGKPLVDKLDGRAIAVDPGPHEFTFETAGMAPAKKSLMIHEAEKDRHEVVSLAPGGGGAAAPATGATPPATATPAPTAPTGAAPAPADATAPAAGGSEGPTASGLELQLSAGYMIPLGSADGASGDDLNKFVSGGVPLRVDVGYRFLHPSIFVGAYFSYAFGFVASGPGSAGGTIGCGTGNIGCSANDLLYGVDAQMHFMAETSFDPWVGLGFGFENASLSASNGSVSASTGLSGLDFVTFMLGADYKPVANFGIGPFLTFNLGQYNNSSFSATGQSSQSNSISNTALHEWLTIGVRGVYDINLGH